MSVLRCLLNVLVVCLSLVLCAEADQRFWTSGGTDPIHHEVDLDLGDRRELFEVDDYSWAERYADGYLVLFHPVGDGSANYGAATYTGRVLRSNTDGIEYLVPTSVQEGTPLFYRLNANGVFLSASPLHYMEPDDDRSRLFVSVAAPLSDVREAIFAAIPLSLDETGDPDAGDYRYRFDAIVNNGHRAAALANNRIYIVQDYQGDAETKGFRAFWGCHLNPVFIRVSLDFNLQISNTAGDWRLSVSDPHVSLSLLDGSDTSCTFVNHSVRDMLQGVLDRQNIKDKAINAVKNKSISLRTDQVLSQLQGVISKAYGNIQLCIYPNPTAFWVGNLRGTFDAAFVDLEVKASPKVVVASTCAAVVGRQITILDKVSPALPPRIVLDNLVPYADLKTRILNAATVRNAGFNDVTFEPHQAYLTLRLGRADGRVTSINAVPTVPVPDEEGSVSIELVFTAVPGAGDQDNASILDGSYTLDLTKQVNDLKMALKGSVTLGDFKWDVLNTAFNGILLTCEPDGMHGYLTFEIASRAVYLHR